MYLNAKYPYLMIAEKIHDIAPKNPPRAPLGKLMLEARLWKYLLALEHISANQPLDLTKSSLIRLAIRERLVTKMQCGRHGDKVNAKYSVPIRLIIPVDLEKRLCIFLTNAAVADINSMLYAHFLDMAQSYIDKEVKKHGTCAKRAFLEFLELNGLDESDFDWDNTFKRADSRLRETRGLPSYFALRPMPAEADHVRVTDRVVRRKADGQYILDFLK